MSDSDEGWYHTEFGMYPRDEAESDLVNAAKRGDLKRIKEIASSCDEIRKASVLNHAHRWTEVQVKSCYDKSWEWFGDTALISAARNGNFEIVKFLLLEGADPTLSSCPSDDEYETALQAVQNRAKVRNQKLEKLKTGTYEVSLSELDHDPLKFVEEAFKNVNIYEQVIKLLQESEKYWETAPYARASFSEERSKALAANPNSPRNLEKYKRAIELISCESNLDPSLVQGAAAKFSELQKRKKILQPPNSKYQQPQISWMSSIQSQKKSNLVASLSKTSNCPGCGKAPAKECVNHSCGRCCSGSCPRHGTDMPVMHNSFWWD